MGIAKTYLQLATLGTPPPTPSVSGLNISAAGPEPSSVRWLLGGGGDPLETKEAKYGKVFWEKQAELFYSNDPGKN